MSDIVERLRAYIGDDHERGCQGRYYDCSCGYDGKRDPLLKEAADEIERLRADQREADEEFSLLQNDLGQALIEIENLRAAIENLRAAVEEIYKSSHQVHIIEIARAALEGE